MAPPDQEGLSDTRMGGGLFWEAEGPFQAPSWHCLTSRYCREMFAEEGMFGRGRQGKLALQGSQATAT